MKSIEITVHELIPDNNGGHYKVTKRIENIPDERVRENDFCTLCQSKIYPECKKICHRYPSVVEYYKNLEKKQKE